MSDLSTPFSVKKDPVSKGTKIEKYLDRHETIQADQIGIERKGE